MTDAEPDKQPEPPAISLKEFLETVPPGSSRQISDAVTDLGVSGYRLQAPKLYMHCSSSSCAGSRWFKSDRYIEPGRGGYIATYQTYTCQNCERSFKSYALTLNRNTSTGIWFAFKYGETPAFGPPTPAKAIALIGPDRELFLAGRRCEAQGLGIGAFTYYRRVIENQRNRIFDEIIRVLKATAPGDPIIQDLEQAKKETQFTKSIETIKHAIPQSLQINGNNPLLLLHAALSEGLHAKTDSECLSYAGAARTVLFDLVDKMDRTLKDDKEITDAVKLLARAKNKP